MDFLQKATDKQGNKKSYYVSDIPLHVKFIRNDGRKSLIGVYRDATCRQYEFCSVENCWDEAKNGSLVTIKGENRKWVIVLCNFHSSRKNSGKLVSIMVRDDVIFVPVD